MSSTSIEVVAFWHFGTYAHTQLKILNFYTDACTFYFLETENAKILSFRVQNPKKVTVYCERAMLIISRTNVSSVCKAVKSTRRISFFHYL